MVPMIVPSRSTVPSECSEMIHGFLNGLSGLYGSLGSLGSAWLMAVQARLKVIESRVSLIRFIVGLALLLVLLADCQPGWHSRAWYVRTHP